MYNHLKVPESWNSYFSKYPQGLTIMEALLDWVGQVDSMIDHINTTDEHIKHLEQNLEEFYLRFDSKLTEQIQNTLQSWIEDGTLEQVISQLIENRMTYPNIPALQQAPNIFKNGTVVELLGYHSAGDGAGHKRIIADEDDGSGVAVGNKWANVAEPILDISFFGIREGDDISVECIKIAKLARTSKKKVVSNVVNLVVISKDVEFRQVKLDLDLQIECLNNSFVELGGNASSPQNEEQYIKQATNIRVIGAKNQNINIGRVEEFEIVARTGVTDYSTAYSTFNINYAQKIYIYGTSKDMWINENTFNLKRCWGVRIGNKEAFADEYIHNHNIFNTGTFEGGSVIDLQKASHTVFNNARFESPTTKPVIFGDKAYMNQIFVSWTTAGGNYTPISETAKSAIRGTNKIVLVQEVGLQRLNDAMPATSNKNWIVPIYEDNSYTSTAWSTLFTSGLIPSEHVTKIEFLAKNLESGGFRFKFEYYDANKVKMSSTNSPLIMSGFTFNPDTQTTTNRPGFTAFLGSAFVQTNTLDHKYIRLIVTNGNGVSKFLGAEMLVVHNSPGLLDYV